MPPARGDFQAVHSLVVVHEGGDVVNGTRHEFYRDERIPAKLLSDEQRDRFLEVGAMRPFDSSTPLPGANDDAAAPVLTQPDGSEIANVDEADAQASHRAARTHAEADDQAAALGITFPEGAKLDAKNEALAAVSASRTAGEPAPTPEALEVERDLSELSDEELIQRGVDFGHTEDEMAEKSHDELVLFVAEAQARQGFTSQAQADSVKDRDANPDAEPDALTK